MLEFLQGTGRITDHRFRLFVEACVGSDQELRREVYQFAATGTAGDAAVFAAVDAASWGLSPSDPATEHVQQIRYRDQAEWLRDIVGNPFRETVILAGWRTAEVLAIATSIDERGTFEHLPMLGAALSDAGCRDATILEHCRQSHHVGGCWLLNAVLPVVTS
jgi:hypothetical protein